MSFFNVELPLNNLSFGQTAINILFEFYKKDLQPPIFPIGPINLNCYNWLTDDFKNWIFSGIEKAKRNFSRTHPTFKIWHIDGSHQQISERQVLFTFHESDKITDTEKNMLSNNWKVLVSSEYTKNVFNLGGADNVSKISLGFDKNSFKKLDKNYFPAGVISFGLAGKLEHRKRHLDVLKLLFRKYGNNKQYFINCALFNQFLSPDQQNSLLGQAMEGKRYFNLNLSPFMDSNSAYNDYLNSNHIIIGMSGAEGWGLPEFQSVALGKQGLILNATGYQEWANENNSVLVEPNGKTDMYDGIFFQKDGEFNQGQSYTWNEDDFYSGLEKAIEKARKEPLNKEGLKLQDKFTWEKTANTILETLEKA